VKLKLLIFAIACTILIILGGFSNLPQLFGTEYLTTKPGYSFTVGELASWWNCSWSYCKKITIDHTKVLSDQTNYPVLIYRSSDADLAAYARSDGYDIAFVDRYNATQYHHEIEQYTSATGKLVAWVEIPDLSSTSDTILYMYYGNPDASNQQNVEGTWESHFNMVQHLEESSGSLYDSTSNNNDGSNNGATYDASSQIDGGYDFDGSDYINCFDEQTEVLTNHGWKLFKDLERDDLVATLNSKNNQVEYHRYSRYISYHYKGTMVHVSFNDGDLLVTPNHNMYVSRYNATRNDWDEYALVRADEIVNEKVRYKIGAPEYKVYTAGVDKNYSSLYCSIKSLVENTLTEDCPSAISSSANNGAYNANEGSVAYSRALDSSLKKEKRMLVSTTNLIQSNPCFLNFLNLPCLISLPSLTNSSSFSCFAPFITSSMKVSNLLRFASNTTSSSIRFSSRGFSPSSIFGSLISSSLIVITTTRIDRGCLNSFATDKKPITASQINDFNSSVETTLIRDCCLNRFSLDHIIQSRDKASAKYGTSSGCPNNNSCAFFMELMYLRSGTTSILLNKMPSRNSISAYSNPEKRVNLSIRSLISSSMYAGEYNLNPFLDNSLIKSNVQPFFINAANNMLASTTNFIYVNPCLLAMPFFTSSANVSACFFDSLLLERTSRATENSTSSMNSLIILSNATSNLLSSLGGTSTVNLNSVIPITDNDISSNCLNSFATDNENYSVKQQCSDACRDAGNMVEVKADENEWVWYDGMVYDVTVPNHILLVRRNTSGIIGRPVWSGNCGTSSSLNITDQITLEAWVKDPPITATKQQKSNIKIVDKRDEKLSVVPGRQFTVERTVSADFGTDVVFVALFSPGVTLHDMTLSDSSIFAGVYNAGKPDSQEEQEIENMRKNLPEKLQQLGLLAYSKPFRIQDKATIQMQFNTEDWNTLFSHGEISYLVFSSDDTYDFEGTTHWSNFFPWKPWDPFSAIYTFIKHWMNTTTSVKPTPHVVELPSSVQADLENGRQTRVIIKFKQENTQTSFSEKTRSLEDAGFVKTAELPSEGYVAGTMDNSVFEQMKYSGDIATVYPDAHFEVLLNESLPLVHYHEALQEFHVTGKGIKICILDTGVDPAVVKYSYGYDFVNDDNVPDDGNGHGTRVASVIQSIAPDAELVVAKVIGASGSGYASDVLEGLQWCIDQNPDIISFSIGSSGCTGFCDSDPVVSMCTEAVEQGIFVVAAAGNDGSTSLRTPACGSHVFSVGATDDHDSIAGFSNVNPTLDLFAPGVDITTVAGTASGTSMSTPFVAATAALVLEHEHLNPERLTYRLRSTGKPIKYVYNDSLILDIARLDILNALANNKTMEPYDYSGWWQCDGEVNTTEYHISDLSNWWSRSFHYRKLVTIDSSITGATLTNFPVLIYTASDADLAAHAQSDGDDIAFVLYSDNTTQLKHEIESFTKSTGSLSAWVNITSLSSTVDTKIWMYYGNTTCGSQQNKAGTWDKKYQMVQHLEETDIDGGAGDIKDSTTYGKNCTTSGMDATDQVAGKIDGSFDHDGTNDYAWVLGTDEKLPNNGAITVSFWVYPHRLNQTICGFNEIHAAGTTYDRAFAIDGNGKARWKVYTVTTTRVAASTTILKVNTWYYVTGVINTVSGNTIYINGTAENTNAAGVNGYNGYASPEFLVGNEYAGVDWPTAVPSSKIQYAYFDGLIDEVRISNITRNTSYIYATYNTTNSPATYLSYGSEIKRLPTITDPWPTNGTTGTSRAPTMNITVNNPDGQYMTIRWYSNSSGSWLQYGRNSSCTNGTYRQTNSNFSIMRKTYYWNVTVNDSSFSNTSAIYHFTTGPPWIVKTNAAYDSTSYNNGRKLVRTSDGNLHTVYYRSSGGKKNIFYAKSTDNGENWTETAITTSTSYDQYCPSIAVDSNDYLHVVWYGPHSASGGANQIRYSMSINGGSTWNAPTNITTSMGGTYYDQSSPSIAVDSNNYLHVVWYGYHTASISHSQIRYSKSTNGGSTWNAPTNITTSIGGTYYDQNSPSIAVDSNNYLHVVWYGPHSASGGTSQIRYSGSINGGTTWNAPTNITTSIGGTYYDQYSPSIAVDTVDSNEYLHVVWYGSHSASGGHKQIRYSTSTNGGSTWNAPVNITTSIGGTYYEQMMPSIAVDSNEYLHVVWYGYYSGVSYQIRYSQYTTSWSAPSNLTTTSVNYYPNLIWANYPTAQCRPTTGYAFVFCDNDVVKYYNSTDLSWITSQVNTITPYWKTTTPLTITDTASDSASGLKNVTLWYRYRANNASSWGAWTNSGQVDTDPWISVSWSFTFPIGSNGHYQFYSIAADNATNTESAPGSADASCGYDNAAPSSSVSTITPYWKTSTPQTLTGTASDTGPSGLKNVTLWYRYRLSNSTSWGAWTNSGQVDTDPWISVSWSFTFPSGNNGHYQFYSIAADNATNTETEPILGSACGYDNTAPTSSVTAITPYWKTPPLTITATATDALSGVKNVTFYYRYSSNNGSWGGWVNNGTDTTSPWSRVMTFSNHSGYYEFYSRAYDNATNFEAAPGSKDAMCGVDANAPTSSVDTITPYWKKTTPLTITATATDALSGVKNVTFYYRFSSNNGSWGGWVNNGTDTTSPWSRVMTFSNGTGYYEFYSRAYDNATKFEAAPGSKDAMCGYDTTAPTSSVTAITPYWKTTTPLTITATATDALSGVKNVTFYYRFSSDNVSWGGWVNNGTDTASPWSRVITFGNGSGHYEFYSRAYDNATNFEAAPGSKDAMCGYDTTAPTSSVDTITPYWKKTTPLTITATASDNSGGSGIKNVTFYYRYSTDNNTWGGWVNNGTDTASPWSRVMTFSNGTGYYEFYSRAYDNATNFEAAPGSKDAMCGYDTTAPTSSVDAISPYLNTTGSIQLTATATDALSGVKNVTLWYRSSADNSSWGSWMQNITDVNSPWAWTYTFPNGTGYYEFYSIAKDNATNSESAPGTADALCRYNPVVTTAPTITTNASTGVEETNATLWGYLQDNGSADTTCWFLLDMVNPPTTDKNVSQGVIANETEFSYDTINALELVRGTLYYFDTKANNSAGWDESGGVQSFLTKPDPLYDFSATVVSGSQIDLSWSNGDGGDGAYIEYASGSAPSPWNPGDGTTIDVDGNISGSSYSHTGLTVCTNYHYKAWAFATDGGWTSSGNTSAPRGDSPQTADVWTLTVPVVVTNTSTGVEETNATLHGFLQTDGGEPCTAGFEYGLTTGYGTSITLPGPFNKLPNPATLPTNTGRGVAFSHNSTYLAVAHDNIPRVTIYKMGATNGTYYKLPNPATLPTGDGTDVAFSHNSTYMAVAHDNIPRVTIYKMGATNGTYYKLPNPATLPTGIGIDVAFSHNSTYMAVAHYSSPYVTIYKMGATNGTYYKLPNPATLPTGIAYGVAFSHNSTYMAVAHDNSPYLTIYKMGATNGTYYKLPNPATLPTGIGRGVAFSHNSTYMAVAHYSSPYLTIYKMGATNGTYYKLPNPATLPTETDLGIGIAFSHNSTYLALGHAYTSPYVTIYKMGATNGTYYKLPNPATLLTGIGIDVAFSHNSTYMAVAHDQSPYVTIYKISYRTGQTFSYNLIGLTSGDLYHYRAYANNTAGSDTGDDYSFFTKPPATTNLAETASTNTTLTYTWTKATVGSGAAAYTRIQYKTGSSPTTISDGTNTYNDTGATDNTLSLTAGTRYYFSAFSWGIEDTVGNWNDTKNTMDAWTNPGDVTSLTSSIAGQNYINLSYTHGTNGEVTMVRRNASGLASYPSSRTTGSLVYNGTHQYANDTGLLAGVTYYYAAWTWDTHGSKWSDHARNYSTTTTIVPPTVTTNASTGVEETNATLHGFLQTDGGEDCTAGFEYGLTTGYGTRITLPGPFIKLPNPATLPASTGRGVAFSHNSTYMAVAQDSSPYVTIYKMGATNGTYYKLPNPATLPTSTGWGVAFSHNSTYLAVAHDISPYVTIYKMGATNGTYYKLPNPATLPTGIGRGVAFSHNSTYMTVAHYTSPCVTIYKMGATNGTYYKLPNPATLPADVAAGVAFSHDSTYMAIAHLTSPYVTIYKMGATNGTYYKLPNPATLPTDTGMDVAFSHNSTYMTVAHYSSPYVTIYKMGATNGTYYKLPNPATLPADIGLGVAFSHDSTYMAIAHDSSPYVTIYKMGATNGTYYKLPNPATLPTDAGMDVTFSHDGTYMAVAHATTPFVTIYKISYQTGETFSYNLIDLTSGDLYHYKAYANNTAGSDTGDDYSFFTKPPATTNLAETSSTNTTLTYTWTKATVGSGAAAYTRIQYQTGSSPNTINTGTNTYNDTSNTDNTLSLTPGTRYYFSAFSWGIEDTVGNWNDTKNTMDAWTNPGDVTSLTSSITGQNYINLSYTHGTNGEVTMVRRNASGSASYPSSRATGTQVYNGTNQYANDTGLLAGVTYYYAAWTWDTHGSKWSDHATNYSETTTIGAVIVVTNTSTGVEETNATLHGFLQAGGGIPCTVRFQYGTTTGYGTNTTNQTKSTGQTFLASITGLTSGDLYHYRAYANNTAGSDTGDDYSFFTKPPATTSLAETASTNTTLTYSWTKATVGSGAAAYTRIQYKTGSSPTTISDGTNTYNDTGATDNTLSLTAGTRYYFSAFSWGIEDTVGNWNDTKNTMDAWTNPGDPTSVHTTNGTTWINITYTHGTNGEYTLIRRNTTGSAAYPTSRTNGDQVSNSTNTYANDTSLNPETTYYYAIWTWDTDGNKWNDHQINITGTTTAIAVTVPIVVTNASTGVEETNATVNGYLQDDGGATTTCGFWWDTNSGTPYANNQSVGTVSNASTFSYNAGSLTPGQLYYFKAWAKNSAGFNGTANELKLLTKPLAPVAASFHAQTNTSIKIYLNWTNGTGANYTRIQRKTGSYPTSVSDGTNVYNQTGTHVEDTTDIAPGTTYYYRAWSYATWNPHQWSDGYENATNTTYYVPSLSNENPTNLSNNIALNPTLSIKVNHSNGFKMNITWYWGTTSNCPNLINTNSSVNNGTYNMSNDNNYSSNGQTYYWKLVVNDGMGGWTNATYHFTTIGANKQIISKGRSAYALEVSPDGSTLYGYINTDKTVQTSLDTNWHYVTLTFDGDTLTMYKDGELKDTTSWSGSIPTNANNLVLGNYLSGTLDEVRISNTARSTAWINTTYLNTNSPTTFATFSDQVGILSTWTYRKQITINHSLVDADLTNFPVLISTTDTDLKNNALSNGSDILFTNSSISWTSGTTAQKLDHEIEKYDSATGQLVAWVRIPQLSSTSNTTIYMYYGNSLCTANRQNPTGVWDSNYIAVWHLNDTPADEGTHSDSTSNNHDVTFHDGNGNSNTDATGIIDGADDLNGDADYMDESHHADFNLSTFTLECWVTLDDKTDYHFMIDKEIDTYTNSNFALYSNITTGDPVAQFRNSGGVNETVTGTTDLTSAGWRYVVAINNGSYLSLYVNKTAEGTPDAVASNPVTQTAPLMIGRENSSTTPRYWNGKLDEIRISNSARNTSWINTTYNTISNPSSFFSFGPQKTMNVAPTQSNPSPANGATGQSLNPTLAITVNDTNVDTMNVTFRTNASGSWVTIGSNNSVYNGTYRQTPSTMSNYNTIYYWSANVTDGSLWTNATYHFTTDILPQLSNPNPANGSTGISQQPVCNVTVSDANGGTVTVYFYENTTGSWVLQQTNSSVNVASPANVVWNKYSNALSSSTKYWWRVCATDSIYWTNATYYFTTSA
jgi:6-phosphogluconolactonase (cycloisomerase 2 family)